MSVRARRGRHASRGGRGLAAAAVLVVGIGLAFAFAGITVQENALAHDINALNAQITAEQAKNRQLQADAALKRTPDYIVDKAKDYGFVWPWETLIAVQRDAEAHANDVPVDRRPVRVLRWVALFLGTR